MASALVIQRPPGRAGQLALLFHGVGSNAQDLQPLGQAIAARCPDAFVASVQAPHPSDFGRGWQWFSVQDVTEANRPARVAAALPSFVDTVEHWQREAGVGAAETALVGFSQGAIMALEATQQATPVARRVVAIAGRFAQPPRLAPSATRVHLLHGEADRVMPVQASRAAAAQLRALGAEATVETFAGLGHGIDQRVLARVLELLAA